MDIHNFIMKHISDFISKNGKTPTHILVGDVEYKHLVLLFEQMPGRLLYEGYMDHHQVREYVSYNGMEILRVRKDNHLSVALVEEVKLG